MPKKPEVTLDVSALLVADERRSRAVLVRYLDTEHAEVARAAEKAGVPVAAWVRAATITVARMARSVRARNGRGMYERKGDKR